MKVYSCISSLFLHNFFTINGVLPILYSSLISTYFSRNVVISLIVGIWILSFIIAFVPIFTNIYTTREFLEGRDPCRCDFVVNEWSVRRKT